MTAATLADLTRHVSGGQTHSKFFPTRGYTVEQLSNFLSSWVSEKAILILTLNLQRMDKHETSWKDCADAWHHHPVAGVAENGRFRMIYPDIDYLAEELHKMVDCESTLLIRAQDIVFQTCPKGKTAEILFMREIGDLDILREQADARGDDLNVLGTVEELLRNSETINHDIELVEQRRRIKIPAAYDPGLTVFINKDDSFTTKTRCSKKHFL